MKRLFIGLMPGFAVQRQVSDHQSRWTWPTLSRVTPPQKLHLTLHFLGQVDEAAEGALVSALSNVRHEAFTLQLVEPGRFLPGGIAWIAPAPSQRLTSLHQATAAAVRSAQLEASAEWTPHVTLARKAATATLPEVTDAVLWHVDRFALMWSTEGKYVQLHSWALQEPGGAMPE